MSGVIEEFGGPGIALVALVILLVVGLWINAMVLRVAVSLLNRFVFAKESVSDAAEPKTLPIPEPTTTSAMGMLLVAAFIAFVIGGIYAILATAQKTSPESALIAALPAIRIICIVVSFFTTSAVFSFLLPTSYLRALGVAFVRLILMLVIYGMAGLVWLLFFRSAT
ncbi:MAG: hypothetical protein KDA74_16970 [Planctomycetaceae bacterium]|nr:hypothetical protein [Planctomycetaceae bacterium]